MEAQRRGRRGREGRQAGRWPEGCSVRGAKSGCTVVSEVRWRKLANPKMFLYRVQYRVNINHLLDLLGHCAIYSETTVHEMRPALPNELLSTPLGPMCCGAKHPTWRESVGPSPVTALKDGGPVTLGPSCAVRLKCPFPRDILEVWTFADELHKHSLDTICCFLRCC